MAGAGAAASLGCTTHKGTPAVWECRPCGAYRCGECVKMLGDGRTAMCKTCGGLATALSVAQGARGAVPARAAQSGSDAPLVERLVGGLGYVARPSVLMVLAGLAIIVYLGQFARGFTIAHTLFATLFFTGIEAAVYFHIVTQVAWGHDELNPPDFEDLWEGAFAPALRYIASYIPLVIGLVWGGLRMLDLLQNPRGSLSGLGAPAALILAWVILWPLMTAVAALGRSMFAMYNPLVWAHTLRVLGMDYAVGAMAFWAVLGVETFLLYPAMFAFVDKVDIPILGGYVAAFVVLVPKALRAMIVGEMCKPYI
jgi:hypothetical protein